MNESAIPVGVFATFTIDASKREKSKCERHSTNSYKYGFQSNLCNNKVAALAITSVLSTTEKEERERYRINFILHPSSQRCKSNERNKKFHHEAIVSYEQKKQIKLIWSIQ